MYKKYRTSNNPGVGGGGDSSTVIVQYGTMRNCEEVIEEEVVAEEGDENGNEEEFPSAFVDEDDDTGHYDSYHHQQQNKHKFCDYLWTCLIIVFWYGISNGIILLTKWLFTTHFPFPLTVTFYSNGIAALWALLVSQWWGCCSKKENKIPLFPSRAILTSYVIPIGILSAVEIGCSNLALQILTVSFGTILKGLVPVFTFGWGVLLGLEQCSYKIGGTLLVIAIGIAVASIGEISMQEFQVVGFSLQLISSMLSGLRWTMTNKLLLAGGRGSDSDNDRGNSLDSSTDDGDADSNATSSSSARPYIRSSYNNNDYNEVHNNNNNNENICNNSNNNSIINDDDDNDDDDANVVIVAVNSTTTTKPLSPLAAILYTSPMTSIFVLPFAMALEGKSIIDLFFDSVNTTTTTTTTTAMMNNSTSNATDDDYASMNEDPTDDIISGSSSSVVLLVVGTMTVIATLVFVLLMSEYWLVQRTSSVTLSVAGVMKELLTILGGIVFFHELVDTLNIIGFVTCQMGIVSYVCLRTRTGTVAAAVEGTYSSVLEEVTSTSSATTDDNDEEETQQQQERVQVKIDNGTTTIRNII